ncbi:hypothetical protein I5H67_gp052 [Mycobacterium phage Moonbeam]|uniref:Uncharacterized protein n=1 Tax=Mycobacterium phage Moonbeam TaxID=2767561 RepID=A0A7G9UXH8_9CAUD|nr:hypothetical protein I5H67_gp052 [Mycobacterium phage Moonbeam]QNN98733.1 hypothetical protein PBI_MOONBEAM_52 [Mycobacterium phage Moonbeam]
MTAPVDVRDEIDELVDWQLRREPRGWVQADAGGPPPHCAGRRP